MNTLLVCHGNSYKFSKKPVFTGLAGIELFEDTPLGTPLNKSQK